MFDNNRQPQPLFVCSQYYPKDNIKLNFNEYIFKNSMVYLGDYTYAVFSRKDSSAIVSQGSTMNFKRAIIISKRNDELKI